MKNVLKYYELLKYLFSFCQPSDSLLVIRSTGPGPPQCLGGPANSMVSPGASFSVFSVLRWEPVDRLDPPELAATVI